MIAVTIGEPAGVGPEICVKSCADPELRSGGVPLVIGDIAILRAVAGELGLDVSCVPVNGDPSAAGDAGPGEIPVYDVGVLRSAGDITPGTVSAAGGEAAAAYVKTAVDLAASGIINGIATAPVHKEALRAAGVPYIGHTEMLAGMTGARHSVTMFAVDRLRIFFHSRHLSLRAALDEVTEEKIGESLRLARRCMQSVGCEDPVIACAALNPHASDGGLFGDEEAKALQPAVERLRSEGHRVEGPVPADSVFHMGLTGRFDAVLSLFHDQGHIAAKTYDFYRTVSITFGLPFIRTSVDHGTAMDVAWKGEANPVSMGEAIRHCRSMAAGFVPLESGPERRNDGQ
jgi:4-hydroxythreonine-4-phosphate dehydrogenase